MKDYTYFVVMLGDDSDKTHNISEYWCYTLDECIETAKQYISESLPKQNREFGKGREGFVYGFPGRITMHRFVNDWVGTIDKDGNFTEFKDKVLTSQSDPERHAELLERYKS
jgi:hypothetical protein